VQRLALKLFLQGSILLSMMRELCFGFDIHIGLVRGAGAFAAVLPSFALVSRMPFAQHNHGFGHFFSATSTD
jgi:hypothetical protein